MKMIIARLIILIYFLKQALKMHLYILFEKIEELFSEFYSSVMNRMLFSA
jgi:hypothetical protein